MRIEEREKPEEEKGERFSLLSLSKRIDDAIEAFDAGDFARGDLLRIRDIAQNAKNEETVGDGGRAQDAMKVGQDFNRIVSLASDAVFVCECGKVRYANPAAVTLVGAERSEDLLGRNFEEFVHPDYRILVENDFSFLESEDSFVPMKLFCDGRQLDVSMMATASPLARERMLLVVKNVTDMLSSARNRHQQLKKLDNILNATIEAIIVTDDAGKIEIFNPAAAKIFGCDAKEAVGRDLVEFLGDEDGALYREIFSKNVAWRESRLVGSTKEILARNINGTLFPSELSFTVCMLDDRTLYTAVVRDIAERKAFQAHLAHAATHDSLTELPNRRFLDDSLKTMTQETGSGPYAIWFIDLGGFKDVNDVMGHVAGDELMIEAGKRLVSFAGDKNIVARFSGDEFVILLKGCGDVPAARSDMRRFMAAIAKPVVVRGREVTLSANVGVALFPLHSSDPQELLLHASAAMVASKEEGKRRSAFFNPAMHERANERLYMENAIRRGLTENQFLLYYQPQIDARTDRIIGMEGLIRWFHPERGLIMPDRFIPIAEKAGLIAPLGEWALRQACHDLKELTSLDDRVTVSFNISPRQFAESDILETMKRALRDYDIKDPSRLEAEITEGALMRDPDQAIKILKQMKALGLRISLDDFGMGYSSLGYLKNFPVDKLKVDRSFVMEIEKNERDAAIAAIVVELAHCLGLKVVAEGAEIKEQVDILKSIGCDSIQGYYYSKPVPIGEIRARLAANREK